MNEIRFTRRNLLAAGGAVALGGLASRASALPADVDYEMHQVTRGAAVAEDLVLLDLPRHSDAGTSVPLTLGVEGPLTSERFPEAVHVYGTNNPRPRLMTVYFTPACGEATVSTRIRLDGAQDVIGLARMNDGSFHKGSAPVSVTFAPAPRWAAAPRCRTTTCRPSASPCPTRRRPARSSPCAR